MRQKAVIRKTTARLPWMAEAQLLEDQPLTRWRTYFATWEEAIAWVLKPGLRF